MNRYTLSLLLISLNALCCEKSNTNSDSHRTTHISEITPQELDEFWAKNQLWVTQDPERENPKSIKSLVNWIVSGKHQSKL